MTIQQTTIFSKKPVLQCPKPTYFINSVTHKIVSVPCGDWHCSVCAKKKASKIQRKATKQAIKHEINYGFARMLTLNLRTEDEKTMMEDLNNLLTQIRKQGYINTYFWVKEFTPPSHEYIDKKGRKRISEGEKRHIHLIWFGRYIHWTTINQYWAHGSNLELVNKSPIRYLIKYLGDSQVQNLFDKNERRYSSSRNFFDKKPDKLPGQWDIYGSWMEGYYDISRSYLQQEDDIEEYKSKFKVPDYHPEYQKSLYT